jgi:AcrR family transcriptional regulator
MAARTAPLAVGLREEKKQRMRRELAETALELFRERGYDETRVRDICERVGISDATFFNYFGSKELLLDELALAQVELFREAVAYQLSRPADGGVPERIMETMLAAAAVIAADRTFHTVLWTRSNLFHSSGVLRQRTHEMYRVVRALFEQGQERGEIRRDADPMQLAELLIAIYQFTTANWLIGWWDGSDDLESRVAAAMEVFLGGCRGQRAPRQA